MSVDQEYAKLQLDPTRIANQKSKALMRLRKDISDVTRVVDGALILNVAVLCHVAVRASLHHRIALFFRWHSGGLVLTRAPGFHKHCGRRQTSLCGAEQVIGNTWLCRYTCNAHRDVRNLSVQTKWITD